MTKQKILKKLEEQKERTQKQLEYKRMQLGEADSAKESRFPTGRNELEDQILVLQNKLESLKDAIKDLNEIKKAGSGVVSVGSTVKIKQNDEEMEFFVSNRFADLNLGVLSVGSPVVKSILGRKKGDVVSFGDDGTFIRIMDLS
jgi:transcription elongation GreA/GreB family factor